MIKTKNNYVLILLFPSDKTVLFPPEEEHARGRLQKESWAFPLQSEALGAVDSKIQPPVTNHRSEAG